LGFLELAQFQSVFDPLHARIQLMHNTVEIAYIALLRLYVQAHCINLVAQIPDGRIGFVCALVEPPEQFSQELV
jgi:hypothetical protein